MLAHREKTRELKYLLVFNYIPIVGETTFFSEQKCLNKKYHYYELVNTVNIYQMHIRNIGYLILWFISSYTYASDITINNDGVKTTTVVQFDYRPSPFYEPNQSSTLNIIEIYYDTAPYSYYVFERETWAVLIHSNYKRPSIRSNPIMPYRVPKNQNIQNEQHLNTLYLKIDPEVLVSIKENLSYVDYVKRFVVDKESYCGIPTATISYHPNRIDNNIPDIHSNEKSNTKGNMVQTIFGPCSVGSAFPAASEEIMTVRTQLVQIADNIITNGSDVSPFTNY